MFTQNRLINNYISPSPLSYKLKNFNIFNIGQKKMDFEFDDNLSLFNSYNSNLIKSTENLKYDFLISFIGVMMIVSIFQLQKIFLTFNLI